MKVFEFGEDYKDWVAAKNLDQTIDHIKKKSG